MINIYPQDKDDMHRWRFCYLHGKAEEVFDQPARSPDIFVADAPMPSVGCHAVMIDGHLAIAVIADDLGHISGRISLVTDEEAALHALTPEDWR